MVKGMSLFSFKKLQITILTIIITAVVGLIGFMMLKGSLGVDAESNVIALSRIALFCLAYSLISWCILRKEFICPYIVYIFCSYIYLLGQCLFWGIGLHTERKDLFNRYSNETMLPAILFTLLCLLAVHTGVIIAAKDISKNRALENSAEREKKLEESLQAIRISAWVLFIVSIVPYYYNLIKTFSIVSNGTYKDLYLQETGSRFDEILEVLRSFYIPSLFMLIVGYPKSKLIFFGSAAIMILSVVVSISSGGRGDAFLTVLGLGIIWHYIRKPITLPKMLIILLVAYIMLTVSSVIGEVRNQSNRTMDTYIEAYERISEKENPAVSAVGEMGWQLSSTVEMINHVPSDYEFRYGSSYFYALTTVIPNLGFWDVHPAAVHANLSKWLQGVMNLNYGPGFSVTAEAYLNFGWFGILFMALEGFLLGKILTKADKYSIKYNPEAFSISIVFLLVAALKAIRAASITLVRSILYNVLPVYLLIIVVKYTMRRVNKRMVEKEQEKENSTFNKQLAGM